MKNAKPQGRPPVIDWKKWDRFLGKIDDCALARVIGCTSTAVLKRRRKLEIASAIPKFGTAPLPASILAAATLGKSASTSRRADAPS